MAKQRKHNFVVGYKNEGAVVYGKYEYDRFTSVTPMTLFQAKRRVEKMADDAAIFKLVEVKDSNGKT